MLEELASYDAWFKAPASVGQILIRLRDLQIITCNEEAERLYRCKRGELIGTSILKLSETPELTAVALREVIQAPHHVSGFRCHRRCDGTTFMANVAFSILRHEQETFVCKFILDGSQAVANARLLEQSNERFRAVADYTYDWESWLDQEGSPIWINPAVERLTGYSVADCFEMESYPLSMVAEEDREHFSALLESAQRGSSGNDVDFRVVRKDGEQQWLAVSWQSLKDADGNPRGFRMSKRDISDRKAMEAKLLEHNLHLEELAAARAKEIVELQQRKLQYEKLASLGVMAASIAHEINNPLAGIKNAVRLVRDRETLSAASSELLRLVDKEFSRVAGLLTQMQQHCQPSISDPVSFELTTMLDEVIAMVMTQNETKQINVRRVGWPTALSIEQREPEMRQIIYNLLLNAFEASEDRGEVEIEILLSRDNFIDLFIRDWGSGISSEILPHLFEPFATTKREYGRVGTGLGLSISLSLATALGGTIEVVPQVSRGTCFRLRLPLRQFPQPAKTRPTNLS